MNFPIALLNLAGSVALLLWGMHMVQSGVHRAFGSKLRTIVGGAVKNRIQAFAVGLGVTALLQSSTATSVMVAGFNARGVIALVPALAVMLGANVGTTLIVQIFSFDVSLVSPALLLFGVFLFRSDTSSRTRDIGRIFIGLGLTLLTLHQLLGLMAAYEELPGFRVLLNIVAGDPFLCVGLTALLAWATHSSVAVILLVMSLAGVGVVGMPASFALVLGANLGAAINPVFESGVGNDAASRRAPVGNLLVRVFGVILALVALQPVGRWMVTFFPDGAHAIAAFHTLFNVILALVFLPLLQPYAAVLESRLPARPQPDDPSRPLYLDAAAHDMPPIALGSAAREALRLADILETMLRGVSDALNLADLKKIGATRQIDDILDHLNGSIRAYLTALNPAQLSDADHRRLDEILIFAMNLEQAGDVIDRALLPNVAKRLKSGLSFPEEDLTDLSAVVERLIVNLRTASSLFMMDDLRAARLLAAEKAVFRDMESGAMRVHIKRLRAGSHENTQLSVLYLDLLHNLKLINSHIVAAAAYPVLQRAGALLPSRLVDAY